ncbi:MAG TPA: 4'-phosphopantetheinyl transferase superfamily protein [Thermoanaerobaculia bacterium]|nr:4'-phosphopantetheinyl transferase superfamily protein [Thermoanaerobaculia bacterium]
MKRIELPESWRGRAAVVQGEAFELALEKRERDRMLSRAAAALLPDAKHVSFSHSEGYGAAAKGESAVGIDVQVVREISERTTHLFLTDDETEMLSRCTIAHRLLHFWCAKEAEWKRHGGVTVTLKKTPIVLLSESRDGLLFDVVETIAIDDVIVALTHPTS